MKLDLQSLSAEPLVYMLMHSGAFVTVLGLIFFFIGLLFGRATWGRYKRQTFELRGEAESMKEELADLKRKLAEHSVKAAPSVGMVTETIPMPRREVPVVPPSFSPTEINIAEKNGLAAANGNGSQPPGGDWLQRQGGGNVIKTKAPAPAEPPPASEPAPIPMASGEPATSEDPDAASAKGASPLAAIIAPAPGAKKEDSAPPPPIVSSLLPLAVTLPEIPSSDPAPVEKISVTPHFDPLLGLVYTSKPDHADDLTALKGIAQVLEQRLHVLGVYTYEQIAGWTPDQIREFSSRLAFKDRILREQWVEQARELLGSRQRPKGVVQAVSGAE